MEGTENAGIRAATGGIDLLEELSRLNNELADMHRELAKKNVELARLNEEKNQFVGMAAHDIRNPLAIIRNYCEILQDDVGSALDQEHAGFLDLIGATVGSALEVVNSFLDVAKIESGKFDLLVQQGDLMEHIMQSVRFHRPLALKKNIALHNKTEHEVISAPFDPRKIRQILDNLLSNAIKFSPPGSSVDIAAAREASRVVVSVRDYGQGIPPQELDRLFKPFGKTSVRSTGGERGTGLGLAIAKKIVVAHGGDIWVETAKNAGTTFYFSLPRESAASVKQGAQGSEATRIQDACLKK